MRILVMLLVACGGAPAPGASPSAYVGRVGITGASWTDVVIDGTDPAAHALCDLFVASEQRVQSEVETGVYTKPCALVAPPAPRPTLPYMLVDTAPVDQDEGTVRVELLRAGRTDHVAPAHGHRIAHLPTDDRATCEAMKKHLDADDVVSHNALVEATTNFLAQQLQQTKQREHDACDRLHADEQACPNLPPDAAAACLGAFASERDACSLATKERESVERKQHAPPPPLLTPVRSCEPVRR